MRSRSHPGLAVVDSFVVPRRDNFNFAVPQPDFRLSGFFYEDGSVRPGPGRAARSRRPGGRRRSR